MYYYPPPANPYAPSPQMVPGGGPFQPFPGGPWFHVTEGGVLEIYANGEWTNQQQFTPNRTIPTTAPPMGRGIGRPSGGVVAGAGALYDRLCDIHALMQAIRQEEYDFQHAVIDAENADQKALCAKAWVEWTQNDPLGQQMAGTFNEIQSDMVHIQDEIDRLLSLTPVTMAAYAQVALLKHALENAQRSVDYYQGLKSDYIHHCGILGGANLPNAEQVAAFKAQPIPLEVAPFPTTVVEGVEYATVPDHPPTGSGPLFSGTPYPKTGPLFGN